MKDQIRKEMLAKREFHHSAGGHVHCISIMDRFVHLPEFEAAKCILLYASKGGEVHTDFIMQSALSLGKKVVLPVTLRKTHELELYSIESIDELHPGEFGILEPKKLVERLVEPSQVDLAVVPGVSFDRRGHRLGYGMGYYDSLLGRIPGKKIGLSYGMQIVEHVPNEPHDVAVDMLVTEEGIISCSPAAGGKPAIGGEKAHPAAGAGAGDGQAAAKKLRVAVLASGRGSDFQSIIDAKEKGEIPIEIVGLLTDNPEAGALERAKKHGIPAFVIGHSSREELDAKMKAKLDGLAPGLVVLAGYMKIIKSNELLSSYSGKMINIHPSLLPKYPGAHAQKDAFEAGEKVSGYTIHFVDGSLDGGPIIYQEEVDISGCKSADEAAAKILEREHAGLPKAVGMFARGKFTVSGKSVSYKEG